MESDFVCLINLDRGIQLEPERGFFSTGTDQATVTRLRREGALLRSRRDSLTRQLATVRAERASRDAIINAAVQQERNRAALVVNVALAKGKPELAAEFIKNNPSLQEFQAAVDVNAKYRREYEANRAEFAKVGLSEESYIRSRRLDDGLERLPWPSTKQ